MKRILRPVLPAIAIMFVFGAISVTESKAQRKLGEILRRMDAHSKALTSLRTNFMTGEQNVRLGDEPVLRTGTVLYAGKDYSSASTGRSLKNRLR